MTNPNPYEEYSIPDLEEMLEETDDDEKREQIQEALDALIDD